MPASSTDFTDVLIIGAGIAGPALACALKDSGLRITLLEKNAGPADTARGDHLQPRTLEILESWGVLSRLLAAGAERRLGAEWYGTSGELLLRSSVAELDLPHPYFAFLNHEKIVGTLLEWATDSPRIRLIEPIRNWWLEESRDDTLTIRVGLPGGAESLIATRLLVGADGRNSRVRRQFGFRAETQRYERAIGVLFAELKSPSADHDLEVYLRDSQIVPVIPRTGGGCKIGVTMSMEEAGAWRRADGAQLESAVLELVPTLGIRNVSFADVYPPIHLRTDRWTTANVVLVGDACHAMHPARSQGMNIAIRCVDELAMHIRERGPKGGFRAALADYDAAVRPGVEALLRENHRHGLEMDQPPDDGYRGLAERLRAIQADPDVNRAYAMRAAGY